MCVTQQVLTRHKRLSKEFWNEKLHVDHMLSTNMLHADHMLSTNMLYVIYKLMYRGGTGPPKINYRWLVQTFCYHVCVQLWMKDTDKPTNQPTPLTNR